MTCLRHPPAGYWVALAGLNDTEPRGRATRVHMEAQYQAVAANAQGYDARPGWMLRLYPRGGVISDIGLEREDN